MYIHICHGRITHSFILFQAVKVDTKKRQSEKVMGGGLISKNGMGEWTCKFVYEEILHA